MKTKSHPVLRPALIALSLAALSMGLTACLASKDSEENRSSALSGEGAGIVPPSAPNIPLPGAFTTYATILGQFSAVTGAPVSSATKVIYDLNRTSFPLQGRSSEISAGMWMSVSALAGAMCSDLYNKEASMDASRRLYYGDFVLGGTNNFNQVIAGQTLRTRLYRKFAAGFWGRTSFNDEEALFDAALASGAYNLGALNGEETRQALLTLCSGALASLSAISL